MLPQDSSNSAAAPEPSQRQGYIYIYIYIVYTILYNIISYDTIRGNWSTGFLDYILPKTPGGFRRLPEMSARAKQTSCRRYSLKTVLPFAPSPCSALGSTKQHSKSNRHQIQISIRTQVQTQSSRTSNSNNQQGSPLS